MFSQRSWGSAQTGGARARNRKQVETDPIRQTLRRGEVRVTKRARAAHGPERRAGGAHRHVAGWWPDARKPAALDRERDHGEQRCPAVTAFDPELRSDAVSPVTPAPRVMVATIADG
jgi:hypothetical protein